MGIFKHGTKLIGSMIIAAVISFFLCISMNIICSAVFTHEIGYTAHVYETKESTEAIAEYEYFYTDNNGDGKDDSIDVQKKEYEDKGYFVSVSKQRSSLSGGGKAVFLITTQLLSIMMVIAFASGGAYKQGFKDSNLVRIGHVKKDMLKGFKIGLIGNIPFFVMFILAIVMALGVAPKFPTVWYAFLNSHFYGVIMALSGSRAALSQLNVLHFIAFALLQFVVPVVSGVAYVLGIKEINLAEKIMYKKEVK
ncbi:MAG: hypothetical protein IJE02_07860 [Clostridia bacterium]|nr:hypothetical protein [Clostridia bacterium]